MCGSELRLKGTSGDLLKTGCSLLCAVGFSVSPRWTVYNFSGQPVPETAAEERREIYFSAPQLVTDLLFVVAFVLLLNVISCVDIPGTRRQYWSSSGSVACFSPCCPE